MTAPAAVSYPAVLAVNALNALNALMLNLNKNCATWTCAEGALGSPAYRFTTVHASSENATVRNVLAAQAASALAGFPVDVKATPPANYSARDAYVFPRWQ